MSVCSSTRLFSPAVSALYRRCDLSFLSHHSFTIPLLALPYTLITFPHGQFLRFITDQDGGWGGGGGAHMQLGACKGEYILCLVLALAVFPDLELSGR